METLYGNKLTFRTFNYLKVNETEIKIPDVFKQDFTLPSDRKEEIKEFENIKYATSEQAIEINKELGNLYKIFKTKENEKKDFGILNLDTDDTHTELLDTIDVVAEKNSELRLVLDYSSKGQKEKFRNSIIRILAKENSKVNLFVIQGDDDKTIASESILVYTKEDSLVNVCQYELGSKNLYTNLTGELIGDKSSLNVNSIYFGYKDHNLDLLYNVYHRGKETKAEILVNGALKDNSVKVFKSNLDFKEGSSASVGNEEEYAILLSDDVTNISVPLLLCHEDNVIGNHAASAGKIDSEILFYIMSRGISKIDAESLIIESKFSGSIDQIEEEKLKEKIWDKVYKVIK